MGIFTLAPPDTALDVVHPEDVIKSYLTAALGQGGVRFTWLDPWNLDLIMNGRLVAANVRDVVRSWRLAAQDRQHDVIDRWVRATLGLPFWEERRRQLAETFLGAEQRLLLRLQPAGIGPETAALVRAYAPGIDMAVFIDVDRPGNSLGYAASGLTTDELARWAVAETEVLAAAHANTRRVIEPWHVGIQVLAGGARVSLIISEDSRGGSPALFLPELLPAAAPNGVLLAVPQHDTAMLHLITDQRHSDDALPWMVSRAAHMFAVMPQPVSPEVYWWHDGEVSLIEVDRSSPTWEIQPSADFMAMHGMLPAHSDE